MTTGSAGPRRPPRGSPGFFPVASQGRPRRGGRERPELHARPGLAGPMPGTGPRPAGGRRGSPGHRLGAPGQLRTYTLAVRVTAELYPSLTNQRRWAFQNAVALSRGHPLIRAAARWDKLDEAAVTIECQARRRSGRRSSPGHDQADRPAHRPDRHPRHQDHPGHACRLAVPAGSPDPFPRSPGSGAFRWQRISAPGRRQGCVPAKTEANRGRTGRSTRGRRVRVASGAHGQDYLSHTGLY